MRTFLKTQAFCHPLLIERLLLNQSLCKRAVKLAETADSGELKSPSIVYPPRLVETGQVRKAPRPFIPDIHMEHRLADEIDRGKRASNDDLNAESALIQESMLSSPDQRTVPLSGWMPITRQT
jgi:hypothetical protein